MSTEGASRDIVKLPEHFPLLNAPQIKPITGGQNNRLYRVQDGENIYALKQYFVTAGSWPRLAQEYTFLDFVWKQGIHTVPKPIARDPVHHLALYQWIEGHKLSQVAPETMQQVYDFIAQLYRVSQITEAQTLAWGSEACHCLADHLTHFEKRLTRLQTIQPHSPYHTQAQQFVRQTLHPFWKELKSTLVTSFQNQGLDLNQPFPQAQFCLSPSDFGFHNILKTPTEQLIFLDFEYAGWDDPAQMVCDFLTQTHVTIDFESVHAFSQEIAELFPDAETLYHRILSLLPLHQLKWCGISLNVFLQTDAQRRQFAGTEHLESAQLEIQLMLAHSLLNRAQEQIQYLTKSHIFP